MLFANATLARRIEAAECRSLVEIARAMQEKPVPEVLIQEIAGGVAVFTGPGSPVNKLAGLGFGGELTESELDQIEREFRRRQAPLQAEVSTLADPVFCRKLLGRGYELAGFENVMGLDLAGHAPWTMPGIQVELARSDERELWIDTLVTSFLHLDDVDGPPAHESFSRETMQRVLEDLSGAKGFRRYLARREGTIAGGASLRIDSGIAQLAGAGTLPDHRRRGVQTALLHARLQDAVAASCDVAVITTQSGSKSAQNAQRRGFALLYARTILVRPPG
jgi:GNAT superfamily N-acetyltransferase